MTERANSRTAAADTDADGRRSGAFPGRGLPFLPGNFRGVLILGAILFLIPVFVRNDYFLVVFNVIALNALVVLGLNLMIASTGQVSLGHAAFYGLGAYISAIASTTYQVPLPLALLIALAVVALVSFLLAIPTLRLEGNYLVMATLGFNIIVSILFGQMEEVTGGPSGFPGIPRIRLGEWVLSTDRSFYYFIWALFLVLFALSLNLMNSRVGRALVAIHERELTARTLGIPATTYKIATFILSALYAAVAGFCYAHYLTFISPKTFDIFYSVQIVTMVVVGGMGSLWGGLAGTALLTYLPEVLHRFEDLHVLIYGLILMGVLVFSPKGLVPALLSLKAHWLGKSKREPAPSGSPRTSGGFFDETFAADPPSKGHRGTASAATSVHAESEPLLRVEGISLGFGGLQALQEVSLEVRPGEVVALIGPNGAGKTTLLNVISGLLKPDRGSVVLGGRNVTGLPSHRIAALGLGRTFQAVQVFSHFSTVENAALGCHILGRSGFVRGLLRTPFERREEVELRERAREFLAVFGIEDKADRSVQELSLLEQKLLELARALALSPKVLLLDEPVGGLNPRESEIFVRHISRLRGHGMGALLVEHDMNVVMGLSDRVVVLQHGCRLAVGTPREIQQNAKVIEAYLGVRKGG